MLKDIHDFDAPRKTLSGHCEHLEFVNLIMQMKLFKNQHDTYWISKKMNNFMTPELKVTNI